MQQTQQKATAQAQQVGLTISTTSHEGDASSTLVHFTQQEASALLIMGATGHTHPWSPTLGGTARKVANEGACSVLLIRVRHTQQHISDLMRRQVATVTERQPLTAVIYQLVDQGNRLLVVVDEARHVLGIITLGILFAHENTLRWLEQNRPASTGPLEQQLAATSKTARSLMQKHPLVLREELSPEEAARQMDARRVTRVPVVDVQGGLVGLLDQADLLRYYTDVPASADATGLLPEAAQTAQAQTIGETRVQAVPLVTGNLPLTELLPLVQQAPQRRIIVVDETDKAIGIIADSDLLVACGFASHRRSLRALAGRFALKLPEAWEQHRSASGPLTARAVMRPKLFAVTPTTSLSDALRLMLAHHIKRLVVVDDQGKPLGLVDRQQLLHVLLDGKRNVP
jgi:CBS domain-containing protein